MSGAMPISRDEQIELLRDELSRLLSWIAAAEGRVSAIFATDAAMLAVMASAMPPHDRWTSSALCWSAAACALLFLSFVFLALSTIPRLGGSPDSIIYFGGFPAKATVYQFRIETITPDDLLRDLAYQCHRNGQIAATKFRWIRLALWTLLVSVAPWIVSLYQMYRMRP